jgi:hypothetical protein
MRMKKDPAGDRTARGRVRPAAASDNDTAAIHVAKRRVPDAPNRWRIATRAPFFVQRQRVGSREAKTPISSPRLLRLSPRDPS